MGKIQIRNISPLTDMARRVIEFHFTGHNNIEISVRTIYPKTLSENFKPNASSYENSAMKILSKILSIETAFLLI